MNPTTLAARVSERVGHDISPSRLRGMLRALFPDHTPGSPWVLNAPQVQVVMGCFQVVADYEREMLKADEEERQDLTDRALELLDD